MESYSQVGIYTSSLVEGSEFLSVVHCRIYGRYMYEIEIKGGQVYR
jgi:hypothetical protein